MNDLKAFGPVWDGAGARGFFCEGYWFHQFIPGLSFKGSTFVAKTATAHPTKGNMPLTSAHKPLEWLPRCIWVDPRRAIALNAVGLSGPGIEELLLTQLWQKIKKRFFLSFMPTGQDLQRQAEVFVICLRQQLRYFKSEQISIQLNISCPNTGSNLGELVGVARDLLDILGKLNVPIVVKLNLEASPEAAAMIARHHACAGICMGNTIPFGTVLPKAWWGKHFPDGSPLIARGFEQPGGLSGAPLLPYALKWIGRFREFDRRTHVNAGGGILQRSDVDRCKDVGANSVSIASVAMFRPWRVRSIIRHAHALYAR
jgi:dihydroorotate dehydrogenase